MHYVFHCQQAVEKLLKAYLVNNRIEFGKTHSFEYLIKLCSNIDKEFEMFYEITASLTDYAVEVRYLDEFYITSIKETKEAFESVTKAKNFILQKLKINEKDIK